MDHRFVTVQTTTAQAEDAERLAALVLESRLAACVQIAGIRSLYRWQGTVQDEPEHLVTCKTTAAAVPGLRELLAREHPYEEPEIIVQPIIDGSEGYLAWLESETRPAR